MSCRAQDSRRGARQESLNYRSGEWAVPESEGWRTVHLNGPGWQAIPMFEQTEGF
jgi:hypothetical protein